MVLNAQPDKKKMARWQDVAGCFYKFLACAQELFTFDVINGHPSTHKKFQIVLPHPAILPHLTLATADNSFARPCRLLPEGRKKFVRSALPLATEGTQEIRGLNSCVEQCGQMDRLDTCFHKSLACAQELSIFNDRKFVFRTHDFSKPSVQSVHLSTALQAGHAATIRSMQPCVSVPAASAAGAAGTFQRLYACAQELNTFEAMINFHIHMTLRKRPAAPSAPAALDGNKIKKSNGVPFN